MALHNIIHLQLLETDEHFYFGSLRTLTAMFGKDKIGITYGSLRAYVSLHDYPYKNKYCIIRKGKFYTMDDVDKKHLGGVAIPYYIPEKE